MDESEVNKLLGDVTFSPGASNLVSQIQGPPQPPAPFSRPSVAKAEREFQQQNVDPGTALDTETGASPWERLMLEMRRSKDSQISYLQNKYGQDKVRMTPSGELIFRVPDLEDKGKEKDVLALPHNKLTMSDFINLSAAIPEVGGWNAAEKGATKFLPWLAKPGVLPAAGRLTAGAVGAETAGAVTKDIPLSLYDKGSADLGEIAKSRGEAALGDVAVGGALNTGGAFLRFLKAPLAGQRSQMQFDALDAAKALKSKYGIDVPMSVGESTGTPLFMRSEAFVEKEPGGSGPIRAVKAEQENQLRRLQGMMMGTTSPLDEEVGKRAIDEIQSKVQPVVKGEEAAREGLAKGTQGSLEGIVSGLTYPDRQLYKSKLGEEVRQAVTANRDAQKAEADRLYGVVRSLPGGTGKVFDGRPLQQQFNKILGNLPSMQETLVQPTGLVGPTGRPLTSTVTQDTTLQKWPPDKLISRLKEITDAKDPKFALSDLQQMRRDIYDDIQKGEGAPGLGVHYLSQIGDAITGFLKNQISSLPSGALKTALEAADKHYREKVIPFNRLGLTELFRAADEPGHVASDQIVNRVLGSGEAYRNWNLMKETLGPTSPTFAKLKRSVADNLIEPAREVGDQTLDAKQLVKNVYDFQRTNREIYDEVFSPKEKEFFRNARMLQYAQGDKIDSAELQKLLASPDPNAAKLKALIDSEKKKTDLYRNSLVKSIGDGTVDESTLKPTEFVNKLLSDKGFGVEDTKTLMGLVKGNPSLEQELKQKTFEKVFRDAARPAKAEDITRTAAGDNTHILSGVILNQALKDKTYKSKLAEILGPDSFEDLQNYIKLTAPLEKKEEAYALAGGLAAGSRIGQLEKVMEGRGGLMKFASNTMRSFVFSYMLSNTATRTYLSRTADNPAAAKTMIMSVLTSPPFVSAVAKQFPGVTGARFINDLRGSIQNSVQGQPPKPHSQLDPSTRPMTEDEKRAFWNKQLDLQ